MALEISRTRKHPKLIFLISQLTRIVILWVFFFFGIMLTPVSCEIERFFCCCFVPLLTKVFPVKFIVRKRSAIISIGCKDKDSRGGTPSQGSCLADVSFIGPIASHPALQIRLSWLYDVFIPMTIPISIVNLIYQTVHPLGTQQKRSITR